jgi:hypothetical protein
MLRIKLLSREHNIEEMNTLELTKKANAIPDAHVREMYNHIKESLSSNLVLPEVAMIEIKNFLNTFLNDENKAQAVSEYLHRSKGVSQFNDLKKLNEDELKFALRQVNLNEENMERTAKSIVSSLA